MVQETKFKTRLPSHSRVVSIIYLHFFYSIEYEQIFSMRLVVVYRELFIGMINLIASLFKKNVNSIKNSPGLPWWRSG